MAVMTPGKSTEAVKDQSTFTENPHHIRNSAGGESQKVEHAILLGPTRSAMQLQVMWQKIQSQTVLPAGTVVDEDPRSEVA